MLELRPYQRAAIDSLYEFWGNYPQGNPLIVLPTGSGKSAVIAKACEEFISAESSTRIVQVVHVRELVEQNYKELIGVWPWAPAGIYSASLGRRDADRQIIFASIQTVYKQARRIGHVDLLVVDEAHLLPRNDRTMYGRFIKELREINPNMLVLGLTATPFRLDSGLLTDGDDALFDDVVFEISIRDLINEGFLSPLISKATATKLDTAGVARRGGDFVPGQLAAAVDKYPITKAAVDEIEQWGADRKSWLLFCAGVDHAHHVRDEIKSRGYSCETITGDTDKHERRQIVQAFKAREIRALTNANVLTTGFNAPGVDLLAMLRPTESVSLYVQMAGRATRTAPGKDNALVLDFAGNVRKHGPVDAVKVKKKGEGGGEAPSKVCPQCSSYCHAAARECLDCGHIFEREEEPAIKRAADHMPILSNTAPNWTNVVRRVFFRHDKPGGTPSIRVEYVCVGGVVHKEWICPEHEGYARAKFEKWWKDHGGMHAPNSIDDTFGRVHELRQTSQILIRASGKYWEINGRKLAPVEPVTVAHQMTLANDASPGDVAAAFAGLRAR